MKKECRLLFTLVALFTVSACSSLPEELNARNESVLTDYKTFAKQQGQVTEEVRLGGVIAKVDNLSDKTRIELVNLPISKEGKPDIGQEPSGRFVVYLPGYLEPVAFSQGRLMTVVGQAGGEEKGKIGDYDYVFPVIQAYGHRLWTIEERVRVYDTSTYLYPCYSISCRQRRDFPRDGKIIKDVN
ncbi:starvation-inducible protein [Vibrio navarrensis]|uniref:Slp family lipoprotein n=1 Tax=Vibrio navarrensis TaxID=29495 RepID=A0AAJ4ICL4_9VIBR|nr:Slp family lipoprotein [Vibrio navarrensis]MBE3656780.1 starvation-inducible protein [Vibrio navarrensis]QPL54375.1 Slp family lipoprotein [Vibrio navarrensis]